MSKALVAWRADLVRDLGGDPSTAQRTIETVVKTRLLLESVDSWLLTQASLIDAGKNALLPVVLQRQALADSLCRMLRELDRRPARARVFVAREPSSYPAPPERGTPDGGAGRGEPNRGARDPSRDPVCGMDAPRRDPDSESRRGGPVDVEAVISR